MEDASPFVQSLEDVASATTFSSASPRNRSQDASTRRSARTASLGARQHRRRNVCISSEHTRRKVLEPMLWRCCQDAISQRVKLSDVQLEVDERACPRPATG